MKRWVFNSMLALALMLLLAPALTAGQARTAAVWDPPRTPDGQPDVQGVWRFNWAFASHSLEEGAEPENSRIGGASPEEIARILANTPQLIVDPANGGKFPYQPWAAAKRREHLANLFAPTYREHVEPEDRCLLLGVPRINYRFDFQIRQIPGYVVILYEWTHAYRVIPLNERPHVAGNIKLFNGDSRGRWEGNTLVVDVTNLNDRTWFDSHGSFHSDALHVIERWTMVDADTMQYEATIEDPKVFTRPWKIAFTHQRNQEKGYELMEQACHEGNEPSVENTVTAGRLLKATGVTGIHEHTRGFYDER